MLNMARRWRRSSDRRSVRTALVVLVAACIAAGLVLGTRWIALGGASVSVSVSSSLGRGWVSKDICSDRCPYARDGVCQEGRPAMDGTVGIGPYNVLCDLGTDCTDCGPWHYRGPRAALRWTPVKDIVQNQGLQLNVRSTATPVPFWMPYSDPFSPDDLFSNKLASDGLAEPGITWIWHKLLKDGCIDSQGNNSLILDIGAGFGYYSLLSAAMGCRVVAWVQPASKEANFFRYGLLRNMFFQTIELREKPFGSSQGLNWMTERVDKVIPAADVLVMRVEADGYESRVLQSSKELLLYGNVQNIIMAYTPGVAETNADWTLAEQNPGKLLGLVYQGYTILHAEERFKHASRFAWERPLPAMPVVHALSLCHDIDDAKRLQDGKLGCPLPSSVEGIGGMWQCPGGFEIERLSPKGFRPTFGMTTTVWASRSVTSPGVCGPSASLMPVQAASYDVSDWFLNSSSSETYASYTGNERRRCSEIDPRDQVRLRCPCSDPARCHVLEAAVKEAVSAGRMPPLPLKNATRTDEYVVVKWL